MDAASTPGQYVLTGIPLRYLNTTQHFFPTSKVTNSSRLGVPHGQPGMPPGMSHARALCTRVAQPWRAWSWRVRRQQWRRTVAPSELGRADRAPRALGPKIPSGIYIRLGVNDVHEACLGSGCCCPAGHAAAPAPSCQTRPAARAPVPPCRTAWPPVAAVSYLRFHRELSFFGVIFVFYPTRVRDTKRR